MAYERFCDIHVTSQLNYHFTSEILDYVKYQLETKRLNALGKKPVIILDFLADWETASFRLLEVFPESTVIIYGDGGIISGMMEPLFQKMKPEEKLRITFKGNLGRMIAIRNKHLIEEPGVTPENKIVVFSQIDGGYALAKLLPQNRAPAGITVAFASARRLPELGNDISYVATSVPMSEISKAQTHETTRAILTWLTGAPSKLRFTCHGDGEGNLQMGNSTGGNDLLAADCVATWLHANGLTQRGQLRTIALNMCLAARYKMTPAVLNADVYTPADGSAVDLVAKKLGSFGVHGITVTGGNEVVDAKPTPSTTRTDVSGALASHGQPFRKISIHPGFTFDSGSLTMTAADGWTITEKRMNDSRLQSLKPGSGWTVKLVSGDYVFSSGAKHVTVGNDGWITNSTTLEVLSAEGWERLDNRRMKFVGTGGAIAYEVTAERKFTIIERLAKSKSKAVATS